MKSRHKHSKGDSKLCPRRESSVEEALIEMYLAGVSVRRVEDITEALWGSKISPATISERNNESLYKLLPFVG